jgi:hypothetical protein
MTERVIDQTEWRWVFISSSLLLVLILLPYLYAYGAAVPYHRFGGFLVNPIDGNSYLAKMYQGAEGSWEFRLLYSPDPRNGVFLFTFYLFLGRVARWLGLELVLILHVTRLLGALYMLLMLYLFVADWTDDVTQRRITWGLAAVGSGFGWLWLLTGRAAPDLFVPEAYPLYAAYANAHFPWVIALLLWIAHTLARVFLFEQEAHAELNIKTLGLVAATLIVMAAAPFALAPLGAGVGIFLAYCWWKRRRFPTRELGWASVVLVSALPWAAYDVWALSEANPVVHAWAAQNQTLSPPPWEWAIGFGPLLLLAGIAIWAKVTVRAINEEDVFLLAWLGANALLLYAPISLQRRLSIGLIAPLSVYAGLGLTRVVMPLAARRWRPVVLAAIFALAVPSTVIALALPMVGVTGLDERMYITNEEQVALDWIETNTPRDSVVLASPSFSLFVPAYTGRRVVYGHQFETVRAEERLSEVLDFYHGQDCGVLEREGVDYVVFGPRERALDDDTCMPHTRPVYQAGGVEIFALDE